MSPTPRSLLHNFRQSTARRAQAAADAEARHKTGRASADAALAQARQSADSQMAEAHDSKQRAHATLAQEGLQNLLEQARPPLFETMQIVGREKVLARLERAIHPLENLPD